MHYLYICDTPYQIFNSIILRDLDSEEDRADLFIVNQFNKAGTVFNNIIKSNLFDHVYLLNKESIDSTRGKIRWKINAGFAFLFPQYVVMQQMGSGSKMPEIKKYDVIRAAYVRHLTTAILSINKKAVFELFEDGTGSYVFDINPTPSKKKYWLYKLISVLSGNMEIFRKPVCTYLHKPSMCLVDLSYEKRKIPEITESTRKKINMVFPFMDVCNYKEKQFIFLSQPRVGNVDIDLLRKSCNLLPHDSERTIVRLHPRESISHQYDDFSIDTSGELWENLISNVSFNNKCLISDFSTAQFTPKLLADQEPWLIFLFGIDSKLANPTKPMIEELKAIYSNPEKIMIPRTYDELKQCIATVEHSFEKGQ